MAALFPLLLLIVTSSAMASSHVTKPDRDSGDTWRTEFGLNGSRSTENISRTATLHTGKRDLYSSHTVSLLSQSAGVNCRYSTRSSALADRPRVLRVIEYFAKSLSRSRSFEMAPLVGHVSPY